MWFSSSLSFSLLLCRCRFKNWMSLMPSVGIKIHRCWLEVKQIPHKKVSWADRSPWLQVKGLSCERKGHCIVASQSVYRASASLIQPVAPAPPGHTSFQKVNTESHVVACVQSFFALLLWQILGKQKHPFTLCGVPATMEGKIFLRLRKTWQSMQGFRLHYNPLYQVLQSHFTRKFPFNTCRDKLWCDRYRFQGSDFQTVYLI